jgi:hypothetical protein
MFGSKKQVTDTLPLTVHTVRSAEAFALAQKLWHENARTMYSDQNSGKELLHFALGNPMTVMWLQRDSGRQDTFELIISWQESRQTLSDIYVILPGPEKAGSDTYVRQVLEGLLTTAATVPLASNKE